MTSFHARRAALLLALSILPSLVAACEPASAPSAEADPAKPTSEAPARKTDMSRFTGEGVVDLSALLRGTPEQVEALLGKPTDTGVQRISCVRFVPERVFFACQQEARFYAHPQLDRIAVEYEDGHAATIQLVGLHGEGEFNPDKALKIAGLALPGNPRASTPTFGMGDDPEQKVQAWDWFNSAARLMVEGKQFRVRVSVVNGEWKRSKVEVIDNTPLDDDQRKRIKTSKSDPGVSEAPATPAP
ncbi:hypothetical protein ACNOYE_15335 [Nannocystaceae bacterium ST9]